MAAIHQLLHSSKSNEWYTPKDYIDAAREVLGDIDVDPASNEIANRTVGAPVYYTSETNGLAQTWEGRVWLNPPYGRGEHNRPNQEIWSNYLIAQYECGSTTEAILLVNAVPDRAWFQALFRFPICFTDHRIRFVTANGQPADAPTNGNAFVYLGPQRKQFVRIFSRFGTICLRNVRYSLGKQLEFVGL